MTSFKYLGMRASQSQLLERLGETLDQLMILDVNLVGSASRHYRAERNRVSAPLSTYAASRLLNAVQSDCNVFIATGCPVRPGIDSSIGEPDGPVGAAALARALFLLRGVRTVAVVPEPLVGQVANTFRAAGAVLLAPDVLARLDSSGPPLFAASVVGLPTDTGIKEQSTRLVDQFDPAALIAVEQLGVTTDGNGYFSNGRKFPTAVLHTNDLFQLAKARSILTITCFDHPNEAGTARAHDETTRHPPVAIDFDVLVPAAVANWAAYAIAAAAGAIAGSAAAAFTGELDLRCVNAALEAGSIDPFTGTADPAAGTDAVEIAYYPMISSLMARAVSGYLNTLESVPAE